MTKIDGTVAGGIEAATWWYERGGDSVGPVSEHQLLDLLHQKLLAGSTMIWRSGYGQDGWKRFDETEIWRRTPPPVPSAPISTKWQKSFDAAAAEDRARAAGKSLPFRERSSQGWELISLWGFLFGPLYYFYLRMWRKGIYIFAFLPISIALEAVLGKIRMLDMLMPIICMLCAKRDFYKKVVAGETIWPFLRWSKSIYTDLAVTGTATIACFVLTGLLGAAADGSSTEARAGRATAQTVAASRIAVSQDQEEPVAPEQLERAAGMSGTQCSIGRKILLGQTFALRVRDVPVDQAKDSALSDSDEPTYRMLMLESIEKVYSKPNFMRSILSNGNWTRVCIKTVRGF